MRAIYKIDFNRLVVLLLPIILRTKSVMALLRVMITPLITLQNNFNVFRIKSSYDLGINGQVCYLQKMLNDNFDIDKRRIVIADANDFQRLYVYTPHENKPIYLHKQQENKLVYFYNKEDFTDSGYDFYVLLNGLIITPQEHVLMRVLTNKYKLTTKKYEIR